ncbi:MAG TPA: Mut7-C RNAse domain-containing protein [Candidatus Acidoferrales bacterium]|nr:Mut7-C RNAse domain-containing protein [Candidatus Acidoferrales bacterium]
MGAPGTEAKELRFAADKMLGRLARWLRILGQDVIYGSHLSGHGLIRAARKEGRVILTRDRRIVKAANLPEHLFIESDHFREQLKQVARAFQLDPGEKLFTRCAECNSVLERIAKESVKDQVPPYVFSTQEKFSLCRRCRRIYWPATHVEKMIQELRALGIEPPGK